MIFLKQIIYKDAYNFNEKKNETWNVVYVIRWKKKRKNKIWVNLVLITSLHHAFINYHNDWDNIFQMSLINLTIKFALN